MPPWPPGTVARTSAPPAWPWPLRAPQPSTPARGARRCRPEPRVLAADVTAQAFGLGFVRAGDSAASPAAQGADEGIDDHQSEDRSPDGGRGGRRLRSGGRLRLMDRGGGQYRIGVVCVQEAPPVQREQQ